jgi:hypothetical protein
VGISLQLTVSVRKIKYQFVWANVVDLWTFKFNKPLLYSKLIYPQSRSINEDLYEMQKMKMNCHIPSMRIARYRVIIPASNDLDY